MRFSGAFLVPFLWFLVGLWYSWFGFGGVCISTCMLKCSSFWCSVSVFWVSTETFYIRALRNIFRKIWHDNWQDKYQIWFKNCMPGSLFSSGIVLCCLDCTVPEQFETSREEVYNMFSCILCRFTIDWIRFGFIMALN